MEVWNFFLKESANFTAKFNDRDYFTKSLLRTVLHHRNESLNIGYESIFNMESMQIKYSIEASTTQDPRSVFTGIWPTLCIANQMMVWLLQLCEQIEKEK